MDKVYNQQIDAALVEAAIKAPLFAQVELVAALQANLNKSLLPDGTASRLVEVMNNIIGYDIRIKNREESFVRARCIVAYVARTIVKMKQEDTARLLKLHSSNIPYYLEKMQMIMTSPFYPDYIQLFNEYVTRLENYGKS